MKRVLILVGFYLPGYKSGGPVRTISNLIDKVSGYIKFEVITSDRDLKDACSYEGVNINAWNDVGLARVYYLKSGLTFVSRLFQLLKSFSGDVIYLNSFFSIGFSIVPFHILMILRFNREIIIAPRGEFSVNALKIKPIKKFLFIQYVKIFHLYRRVVWHATSVGECGDVRRVMGEFVNIKFAPNISKPSTEWIAAPRNDEKPLRLVFLSRISRMKNLNGALDVLSRVNVPVDFDIYGPLEDELYWNECLTIANRLPVNINCTYRGILHPSDVIRVLSSYDLFFFPTLGENYGHVIAEALSAGLPLLISNKTPWLNLNGFGLGWDMDLSFPDELAGKITSCHMITSADYLEWRKKIRNWALVNIGNKDVVSQNIELFIGSDSEL